jgi:hypothetical protein
MKRLVIIALIVCVFSGTAMAANPSVFDLGLVNTYTIQDLADTDFATYTPGLRATFYVNSWFGISGDVFLTTPFVEGGMEPLNFLLSTDLVVRAPLGFFEPYLAIGPSYFLELDSGALTLAAQVPYSARVGFDFNITPVFALGIEGIHMIPNLSNLIAGTEDFDLMNNTQAALVIKLKM